MGPQINVVYHGEPHQGDESRVGSQGITRVSRELSGQEQKAHVLSQLEERTQPHRVIPYCRNTKFTGRKKLINLVKRFAHRNGHNRIALLGLGGSGKTQIALEYVYQHGSETGCHVFWVQGSGVLKFSEGFRDIAQHVQIPIASADTDEEGFLLSIKRWFEGSDSGDWILVIDNADNEEDFFGNSSPIAKFLPQGTRGTLIFTTRSDQVACREGCERINVGKMKKMEAKALFAEHFGSRNTLRGREKKAVAKILGSVGYLPLAVVGTAAFMVENGTLPSRYWTTFQQNDERMKELLSLQFRDIQKEASMTESILGTYFITFDQITKQMPAAGRLLRLIAFFDRQNIPEELLEESGVEGMDSSVEFLQAIGKLSRFSLVTTVRRENKTFYELHHLIQLSIQTYLSSEELGKWSAAALGVIARVFPKYEHNLRDICELYIPHALAVTRDRTDVIAEELCFRMGEWFLHLGSYSNAEGKIRQSIRIRKENKEQGWDMGYRRSMLLGRVCACQGKAPEAKEILQNVLKDLERLSVPNSPERLECLSYLASVMSDLGRHDESEAMLRRALVGLKKHLGPEHRETLTSVSRLAFVLQCQGKYDESERMSRESLELSRRVLEPDHPDVLTCANNLALVLQRQGRYGESEMLNRGALEGREKTLGPDHPHTLTSVNNMAIVLEYQGKYGESEKMHRRALEGLVNVLGPDHPDTLTSINNLSTVLQCQGNYKESEDMIRRALEGREKTLGPKHPATLTSINNLATILQFQGVYDESEIMNRRAIEVREKVLGPDHPDTLTSVNNLAILLQLQERYNESEEMTRHALEGRRKILGPDHPDTLISVDSLAIVLQHQGKYGDSETMNRCALKGRERVLGLHHPYTLSSLNNLAIVLDFQGKYNESEAVNRRALERHEKAFGPDHLQTLSARKNLALALRYQKKYDESEIVNRRAYEGLVNVLGPDHPDTLTCANNLAVVLDYKGEYDESEELNRSTLEGFRKALGPDHPRTLASVNNLAVVLRYQLKYEESEGLHRDALEARDRVLGPDHPDTLVSINNLAVVLECQGKYKESASMKRCARERLRKSRARHSYTLRAIVAFVFRPFRSSACTIA